MTSFRTHRFRRSLFASAATVASLCLADAAAAQTPTPANPTNPASPVNVGNDQIVITGTRRTDRTVTTSASPIDIISSTELTGQPTANILDTIKNIVPSF